MNKRIILLTLTALLMIIGSVNAQKIQKKDDPVAKLPFKKKLKYADNLFKESSYYTAEEYYFQLLKERPRNPHINWKLAEALRYNRDYPLAAKYYRISYELLSTDYVKAPYYEGHMRKMNGEYDEAIARFQLFMRDYKGKDKRKLFKQVKIDLAGCEMAKKSILNPERAYVKNAGPNVNSAYTEYAPWPLGDSALLYATMNENKIIYKGKDKRKNHFSKFRWAPKEFDRTRIKDSFEVSMDFKDGSKVFKSKNHHIGNGAWSPGGDRFYYTKCNERDSMKTVCEIWVSNFNVDRGIWGKSSKVEMLNFRGDAGAAEDVSSTNPYVAYIGNKKEVIFFSSNRKLQGRGGYDIWYSIYDSTREESRRYRRAQNCGKKINTVKDEITPYYDSRKGQLYFASNGQIGVGGFDVFVADGGPSRYYKVRNLGFPVNSPQDDMYYIQDDSEKSNGYVVSNRYGSYYVKNPTCCDDIWRVIKEPNFYVRGKVVDENTGALIDQAVIKMTNDNKGVIQDTFYSKSGKFMFYTPLGNNYSLAADKEGYVSGRTIVNTSTKSVMDPDDTTSVTIYMQKIGSNTEFRVKNVYYDFATSKFHDDSYASMDSLVNFMKDNPAISVEIRSHTDNIGTGISNKGLSLRRAKAVLDYLVKKGVERSRMVARGLGENEPMERNNSQLGRQYNRRTEFRIIGDVPGMRIFYDKNRPQYIDKSGSGQRDQNLTLPDTGEDDI